MVLLRVFFQEKGARKTLAIVFSFENKRVCQTKSEESVLAK